METLEAILALSFFLSDLKQKSFLSSIATSAMRKHRMCYSCRQIRAISCYDTNYIAEIVISRTILLSNYIEIIEIISFLLGEKRRNIKSTTTIIWQRYKEKVFRYILYLITRRFVSGQTGRNMYSRLVDKVAERKTKEAEHASWQSSKETVKRNLLRIAIPRSIILPERNQEWLRESSYISGPRSNPLRTYLTSY